MIRIRPFGYLLALIALLIAVGCSKDPQDRETVSSSTGKSVLNDNPPGEKLLVGLVFDSGGRGDKSFNDSAAAGLDRAVSELKVDQKTVESKTEKDYEGNLTAMAEAGCKIVFAIGINMKSALEKVAPNFPDVKFAIVDAVVDSPNVRSLVFKEEEGSFLAGYLAGSVSKSGKIGFVGGMDLPLIKKFEAGFEAGAKTANPDVQMLPAKYTGSWDNVDTAKEAAAVLYNGGADVVYHAAGRAGLGVFRAAKESGKYAIGVDSDQDDIEPGTILTSMIKRVDEAVFQTIKDLQDQKFTAETKTYDLKAGGVSLSPMTHTKDKIGQDILDKIEKVKGEIVAGTIVVPHDASTLKEYMATLKTTPK